MQLLLFYLQFQNTYLLLIHLPVVTFLWKIEVSRFSFILARCLISVKKTFLYFYQQRAEENHETFSNAEGFGVRGPFPLVPTCSNGG